MDMYFTIGLVLLWIGSAALDELCPATVPQCYCRPKYTFYYYIYCEYLGDVLTVPDFNPSNRTYEELQIQYGTTVERVQDNAFSGIILRSLKLQF